MLHTDINLCITQYQQQTLKIMEAHKTHNGSVNFLAQVCVFNR